MVIYGFDYPNQSVDTLIEAFETLADRRVVLGPLNEVELGPLVHPVHAAGRVFGHGSGSRHATAARAGGWRSGGGHRPSESGVAPNR